MTGLTYEQALETLKCIAAPCRHRPRPHHHATRRSRLHPRRHRLPEDRERHELDGREPGPGRARDVERAGFEAGDARCGSREEELIAQTRERFFLREKLLACREPLLT